jgi:hypothetical protein
MLFKDLIKVYKVYYVHITELLERFEKLGGEEQKRAFEMYQLFVVRTDGMKTKAAKLVYQFNFPIQLPDFYNPEKDMVETLRVVVEGNDQDRAAEIAKKVRGGMNRDQFKPATESKSQDQGNNDADGDKEYYFDCTVMDKLDVQKAQ